MLPAPHPGPKEEIESRAQDKKWDLEKIALKYRLVFFIPDMADSLYRLTPKKPSEVSDIHWLKQAYRFYNGAIPESNVLVVGVSTGAEGALKFAENSSENDTTFGTLEDTVNELYKAVFNSKLD